jgi:hypothetical protein
MKKLILGFIITIGFASCKQVDTSAIEIVFQTVNVYESDKIYNKLFEISNQNTTEYFKNIKAISLSADSNYVRSLNTFDKLLVLQIRGSYELSELDTITEKQLFVDYYNGVQSMKTAIMDRVLKNISGNDTTAQGEINSRMMPYPDKVIVKFTKEGDEWKYDFPSYFEANNTNIEKSRSMDSSESEDDYLSRVLRLKGIQKSYNNLWIPMKK